MCLVKLKFDFVLAWRLHLRFNKCKELSFTNNNLPRFFNYLSRNQFNHKTHMYKEKKKLVGEISNFSLPQHFLYKERKNKKDRHSSAKQLPWFTTSLCHFDYQPDIPIMQGSLLFFFFCCISLSPLFCKVNSDEWINSFFIVHVVCEQWRASPLFVCRTMSDSNLNVLDRVQSSKIK